MPDLFLPQSHQSFLESGRQTQAILAFNTGQRLGFEALGPVRFMGWYQRAAQIHMGEGVVTKLQRLTLRPGFSIVTNLDGTGKSHVTQRLAFARKAGFDAYLGMVHYFNSKPPHQFDALLVSFLYTPNSAQGAMRP